MEIFEDAAHMRVCIVSPCPSYLAYCRHLSKIWWMSKGIFTRRRESRQLRKFLSRFTFLMWLECGLFSPPSKPKIAHARGKRLHPGCGAGMFSWNGILGVGSATHRLWVQGLMAPMVQSPQTLVALLRLSSCCGRVSLPTGAQLLRAALMCLASLICTIRS